MAPAGEVDQEGDQVICAWTLIPLRPLSMLLPLRLFLPPTQERENERGLGKRRGSRRARGARNRTGGLLPFRLRRRSGATGLHAA